MIKQPVKNVSSLKELSITEDSQSQVGDGLLSSPLPIKKNNKIARLARDEA